VVAEILHSQTHVGFVIARVSQVGPQRDQINSPSGPVLSVRGTDSLPLFVEGADFLRSSIPHLTESTIDGVGHLLHIQHPRPVARAMARFLNSNCVAGN
jgi:pimeloyl-ACP methyl ester carboxylesterase